ncbi:hypothetical protein CGQ36_15695 [Nocardiopsis dassonvillei]|nr:hypothetical protein CGQ36_15695 [Nocardiopsis dassonvillei]
MGVQVGDGEDHLAAALDGAVPAAVTLDAHLGLLHELGQEQAVAALLKRVLATRTDFTSPASIAFSLRMLRRTGLKKAAVQLMAHIANHVDLSDPDYALVVMRQL